MKLGNGDYKSRNLFIDYVVDISIGLEETLYIVAIDFQQRCGFSSLGCLFGHSYLSPMHFYFLMLSPKPMEGMSGRLYCLFCLQDIVQELYYNISSQTYS